MAAVIKADLREQVGIAVNAKTLDPYSRDHETALDRVGALGAATRCVQLGADRENLSIASALAADVEPIDQDVIAGELGALLWRIRFGRQHDMTPNALVLLREYMLRRRMFAEIDIQSRALVVEPFAVRLMHEWLSDKCVRCAGTGLLERTVSGALVRSRARARNAIFHACSTCQGTKRATPSHTERARALGIPKRWYFECGWPGRFNAGRAWLDQLVRRIQRPLTQELGRRIRRPQQRTTSGG